jgi:hypothetical protein
MLVRVVVDRVVARGLRAIGLAKGGACHRRQPRAGLARADENRVGRRRGLRVGSRRRVAGRGRVAAVTSRRHLSGPWMGGCSSRVGATAGRVMVVASGGGGLAGAVGKRRSVVNRQAWRIV